MSMMSLTHNTFHMIIFFLQQVEISGYLEFWADFLSDTIHHKILWFNLQSCLESFIPWTSAAVVLI